MLDLLISLITHHGLHTPSNLLVSAQGLFSYELHLYDNTSNMGVRGWGGVGGILSYQRGQGLIELLDIRPRSITNFTGIKTCKIKGFVSFRDQSIQLSIGCIKKGKQFFMIIFSDFLIKPLFYLQNNLEYLQCTYLCTLIVLPPTTQTQYKIGCSDAQVEKV